MSNSVQVYHPRSFYLLTEDPLRMTSASEPTDPTEPSEPTASADPGLPPDEFAAGLSPDALMAYCQSRLDSIDGQVGASFDSQQRNASSTKLINQMMAAIKQYGSADQKDPAACKELETAFEGVIKSIAHTDPGCSALKTLTETYNAMVHSGDGGAAFNHSTDPTDPDFIDQDKYPYDKSGPQGDGDLSAAEIQNYGQTLTDAAGNINSDSELQMVHLQSLMAQRQTAISLTTNLVQSLGDQENKIADNIGH